MTKVQERIEEIINEAIEKGAFPGANYAVVTKNGAIYGSLGKKELYPNPIDNDIDTIYDMASLTKVVCTTTCMMKLLENGDIRLYDSISRYLPRFKHEDLTIWHLMTHCSGLREGVPGNKYEMSEDQIWDYIYNLDLDYKPGEHITYSDINYILLGQIIKVVTGLNVDEYSHKYIFAPLNMVDTGFNPKDVERCAATEYREHLKGYQKATVHDETSFALGGVAGHAGLFSTIKDLIIFLQMILNDGKFDDVRILNKNTIDLLFKTQVKEYKGVEVYPLARALGWQVRDPFSSAGEMVSDNTILHTGYTGTNIFIDRDNEIAFVMLTNRVHPLRGNVLHMHYRACLGNYIISHLDEFKKAI